MKAIHVKTELEGRPLAWLETAEPVRGDGEVLVEVHATALNRADLLQRAGGYPPPPGASEILGLEMAGEIVEVGMGVTGWRPGDRVCALLSGGGYAERVAVPARMLIPVPRRWSYEQAAAVPEVFLTAYVNLFMEAGLAAGETILMHGGAGGVGTAAIQLVREAGGRIIVTAGTAAKVAFCRKLGADLAIPYKEEDWVESTLAFTGGSGVDVILDTIGAPYLEHHLRLLKTEGAAGVPGHAGRQPGRDPPWSPDGPPPALDWLGLARPAPGGKGRDQGALHAAVLAPFRSREH